MEPLEGVGAGHGRLDICGGGGGAVQFHQVALGVFRNDGGHRGLSHPCGAIEHHVGNLAGLDNFPQGATGPKNMPLAHHLIQGGGADPVRQRRRHKKAPFPTSFLDMPYSTIFFPKTQLI